MLASYQENRKQFVKVKDRKSKLASLKFGVPQRSILGSKIFNLYVADLAQTIWSNRAQRQSTQLFINTLKCREYMIAPLKSAGPSRNCQAGPNMKTLR